MMVQIDDVLDIYFRHIPSKLFTSQSTAFEVYELCLKNSEFFRTKTKILIKYMPNLFRFAAWWPCNFLEEACEILRTRLTSAAVCGLTKILRISQASSKKLHGHHAANLNKFGIYLIKIFVFVLKNSLFLRHSS